MYRQQSTKFYGGQQNFSEFREKFSAIADRGFPGMVLTSFAMQYLSNKGFFKRYPWANTPIQLGLVGVILIFATPLGCALFSQTASINVSSLEPEIQEQVKAKNPNLEVVYYNKGL